MDPEFAKLRTAYNGSTVLNETPVVAVVDDFVSAEECRHIIELANGKLSRALVSEDEQSTVSPGRSGSNCWLPYDADEVVDSVAARVADYIGIPLGNAEKMQIVHYAQEQEYRPHNDAYDLNSAKGRRCCRFGGQRLVTALVYLNDVEGGGGTRFPKLDREVAAKQGRMTVFHNVLEDKVTPHPLSLHAGMPVTSGEKWAFNIWFRARPMKEEQAFDNYSTIRSADATTKLASSPEKAGESDYLDLSEQAGLRIISNRARSALEQAASIAGEATEASKPLLFSYWDSYKTPPPEIDASGFDYRSLLDRKITNPLADREKLFQSIRERSLDHLAPQTLFRAELEEASIKFLKGDWVARSGTRAEKASPEAEPMAELWASEQQADTFYQRLPENRLSYSDKDFLLRGLLLAIDGRVLFYESGVIRCGSQSIPSTLAFKDRSQQLIAQSVDALAALLPLLEGVTSETARSRNYALLAVDFICLEEGPNLLYGFSNMPNLVLGNPADSEFTIPMFAALLTIAAGKEDGAFVEIQPA